jgi:hypothetical protein
MSLNAFCYRQIHCVIPLEFYGWSLERISYVSVGLPSAFTTLPSLSTHSTVNPFPSAARRSGGGRLVYIRVLAKSTCLHFIRYLSRMGEKLRSSTFDPYCCTSLMFT